MSPPTVHRELRMLKGGENLLAVKKYSNHYDIQIFSQVVCK